MLPRSTHETFAQKLYQTFKNHIRFSKPKLSLSDFTISHYAGDVACCLITPFGNFYAMCLINNCLFSSLDLRVWCYVCKITNINSSFYSGQFFQDMQSQLENDFMKSLQAEVTDDYEAEAIRPLSWYPGNVAWHLNFSRMQLRKNQALERSLSPLREVGLTCFRDLVYQEIYFKVRDAVISLIDQEREGEQIDGALLKNVLDIFVEIGLGKMEFYENNFEADMLKDIAAYYSRKASSWISEDSCPAYMLKAEECLKREKNRVSHYLHSTSETKAFGESAK